MVSSAFLCSPCSCILCVPVLLHSLHPCSLHSHALLCFQCSHAFLHSPMYPCIFLCFCAFSYICCALVLSCILPPAFSHILLPFSCILLCVLKFSYGFCILWLPTLSAFTMFSHCSIAALPTNIHIWSHAWDPFMLTAKPSFLKLHPQSAHHFWSPL